MRTILILSLGIAGLGGCANHVQDIPPVVVTKDVNIATPIPCPAMAQLGPETSYADTDSALASAPDIFESTRLLLKGRLQRSQRLGQYIAARVACTF